MAFKSDALDILQEISAQELKSFGNRTNRKCDLAISTFCKHGRCSLNVYANFSEQLVFQIFVDVLNALAYSLQFEKTKQGFREGS